MEADDVRARKRALKTETKPVRAKRPVTARKPSKRNAGTSGKRFFAVSAAKTIKPEDVPGEVKIREGRWMTEDQKKWIFILREDNWKVEEIAELMGFCHTAIVAQLKKRERATQGGDARGYSRFYEAS